MLRARFEKKEDGQLLTKIKLLVDDGSFDQPIEIAAWKCYRDLVLLTPKKWTGLTRRSWTVSKPQPGERLVFNTSKTMRWLEDGTANGGQDFIYPKSKKFLFIPLTSRAAIGGWSPGMVFGTDYVLRRRVRGITPRHIVKNYRPKAREHVKGEMKAFLKRTLK